MSDAGALHRAWIEVWVGVAFLLACGLQLWTCKTLGRGPVYPFILDRKDDPIGYWLLVAITVGLGVWLAGKGLRQIL